MKKLVHFLIWVHFLYLLLLPAMAVVSAFMMFPREESWLQLTIFGFPAVTMYSLFLASGYTMPESLVAALLQVLAIPLQIGIGVAAFGGGSLWLFLAEAAAVEIGSFVLGVLWVALGARRKDSSTATFALILILAMACFFGGTLPHLLIVINGYGGFSPWLLFFITAFATGFLGYSAAYRTIIRASAKSGQAQNLEMLFNGGPIARLILRDREVKLISPLWRTDDRTQFNPRVYAFGLSAMFLPAVVAIALGVAFRP